MSDWAKNLEPQEIEKRKSALADLTMPSLTSLQTSGQAPIKTITAGYRPYMPASAVYSYVANKDGMKGGSMLISHSKGKKAGDKYIAAGGQEAPMDFYFGPPVPKPIDPSWAAQRETYNQAAGERYDLDALFSPERTPNDGAFRAGAQLSADIKAAIEGDWSGGKVTADAEKEYKAASMGKKETELKDLFVLEHAVRIDSGKAGSSQEENVWVFPQPGAEGGKYSKDGVDWARGTLKESQMTQKLMDVLSFEATGKWNEYAKSSGAEVTDADDKWIMGGFSFDENKKDAENNPINKAQQIKAHVDMRVEQLLNLIIKKFNGDMNEIIKGSWSMDDKSGSGYKFKGGKYVDPLYGGTLTETPHIIAKQFADRAKRIWKEQATKGTESDGSYLYIVPAHHGDLAVIRFFPIIDGPSGSDDKLKLLEVVSDVNIIQTGGKGDGKAASVSRLLLQHMIKNQGLTTEMVAGITSAISHIATLKKSVGANRGDAIGSRVMVDYGTFFGEQLQPYMAMALTLTTKQIADSLTAQINNFFASPEVESQLQSVIGNAQSNAAQLTRQWKNNAYPDSKASQWDNYGMWPQEPFAKGLKQVERLTFPFFIGTSQAVKAVEAASPTVGVTGKAAGQASVKQSVRYLYDKDRRYNWKNSQKKFRRPEYHMKNLTPALEVVHKGVSTYNAPLHYSDRGKLNRY